ncbi:MAG TPA: hypothetical protein VFZ69_11055 [Longimicrobiales bacterium]
MSHRMTTALALAVVACATSPTLPENDPALSGSIVARDIPTSPAQGRATIHVKEHPSDPCGIIFTVTPETQIFRRTDRTVVRAEPADLTVSRSVAVWARAILESCPAQARADAIEILSD